jgi:hypothetical protein
MGYREAADECKFIDIGNAPSFVLSFFLILAGPIRIRRSLVKRLFLLASAPLGFSGV